MSKKKFSNYRRKKMQGIRHQGWVNGIGEAQKMPSSESFQVCASMIRRSFKATLPSGKTVWVSRDDRGQTVLS